MAAAARGIGIVRNDCLSAPVPEAAESLQEELTRFTVAPTGPARVATASYCRIRTSRMYPHIRYSGPLQMLYGSSQAGYICHVGNAASAGSAWFCDPEHRWRRYIA